MAGGEDRDPIEVLAEEFLSRKRRGDSVSIRDYILKYPDSASEIEGVFSALLVMEDAKPQVVVAPQLDRFDAIAKGQVRKLGDFRIIRKIAHGGMGVVYEAEETSLDRRVAIKVLSMNLTTDPATLERFKREAKAIARLHHTNIVNVFGSGVENDVYYFVMEFIDGKSLDRLLESGEFDKTYGQNWSWIAETTRRAALALRHAHEQGVLHRDVKPGNVLIDTEGKPWLTDFGLAKFGEYDDLTRPGDTIGTLRYMAPEQMQGKAGQQSDVFGLGLIMYEMMTGTKVYGQADSRDLFDKIRNRELAVPTRINPSIPTDLEQIVLKATAIDPTDRYQSAIEFADDLERWQKDLPVRARPLTTFQTLKRWAKRSPIVAGLAATVTLLVFVLVISFGVIAFALLNEHQAKLESKESQLAEKSSRLKAEKSLEIAMSLVDQLSVDLGLYQVVGLNDERDGKFLYSPIVAIPISKKADEKLGQLLRLYVSIGEWSQNIEEIQSRRLRAITRSCEIYLQSREYERAKTQLAEVIAELEVDRRPEISSLFLHANNLMGYANILTSDYDEARGIFDRQKDLITSLELTTAQSRIEQGKANLGSAILAHHQGDIARWHQDCRAAIECFESEVNWKRPMKHPEAALLLARSYLSLPPTFRAQGNQKYLEESVCRAVSMLFELNRKQRNNEIYPNTSKLLFFFDYCFAVSSLPTTVARVDLGEYSSEDTIDLLLETIQAEEVVLEESGAVPAFRLAIARCYLNLGRRIPQESIDRFNSALLELNAVLTQFPDDPILLTQRGEVLFAKGRSYQAKRKFKQAKDQFQRSIRDLERSLEYATRYPKTKEILRQSHLKLADVFDSMDDGLSANYHRSRAETYRPKDGLSDEANAVE